MVFLKRKSVIVALASFVLISILLLISLGNKDDDKVVNAGEVSNMPLVEVKELEPMDLKEVFNTIGFFVPENDWRVTPDTVGTVEKVLVTEGDMVEKDELLFQLENSSQKERVEEAKQELRDARNNLQEAKTEENWSLQSARESLDEAKEYEEEQKQKLEEAKEDYKEGEIDKRELERAEDRYDLAKRRTERAQELVDSIEEDDNKDIQEAFYEEQVKWAERLLERAEKEYEKTYVKAPSGGEILSVRIQKGDTANPITPAIVIVSQGKVHVSTSVSEQYVVKLAEGDSAKVTVPAISDKQVSGTITEVGVMPEDGGRFYPVNIILDESIDNLKVGMNAQIQLTIASESDVLAVPRHAIVTDDDEDMVYVLDEDNLVHLKPVTTGISENGLVHVEGLNEGDKVVVAGISRLEDGTEVEVVKEDK
ncbi:efflux RND transporter periplasmic adaptor subunit [Proteinivorax hydrogeniformans]|uniref:Efflux RND transporter periplasmic adaptor subunit n=1 Tax=Proteinivorax hydrogeniformans TaxID=1826727 RepID=A0AAU8HW59_9FIRM